jgi:hypothetical protein
MTCKDCNSPIPHRIEIDGKRYILKNRKYCLKCSPFKNRTFYVPGQEPKTRNCIQCKKPHRDIHRQTCSSCRTGAWRERTKKRLVEYKGGSCQICGYKKCLENLGFHHLDPNKKDFAISCAGKGISKLKIEVDKCVLLCCRCHGEVHAGLILIPV